jgi:hypothetical protein
VHTSAISTRIAPESSVPLFGRSNRRASFEFVANELEANLIALPGSRGLLVLASLDTLFASSEFKAAVLERLGSAQRACIQTLVFIASHTHSAPALDAGKPRLGKIDRTYFDLAVHRVAAALEALIKAEPKSAKITQGKSCSTLNASRRRKGMRLLSRPPFIRHGINMVPFHCRSVPRDIAVIVAKDEGGPACWVIWHWACHATAAPDRLAVSSDFPGEVRASLRRYFNNADLPVLFFPGFCGDIRPDPALWPVDPRHLVLYPLQRPFARPTAANFHFFCNTLSCQVEAACRQAEPLATSSFARITTSEIPLAELIDGTGPGALEVIFIDAGAMDFVFISAEVCSGYLAKLERKFPPGTLMCGYANDVRLYLPDDKQIEEGGYEAGGFFSSFGLTGSFKPNIETTIIGAAGELALKAARNRV